MGISDPDKRHQGWSLKKTFSKVCKLVSFHQYGGTTQLEKNSKSERCSFLLMRWKSSFSPRGGHFLLLCDRAGSVNWKQKEVVVSAIQIDVCLPLMNNDRYELHSTLPSVWCDQNWRNFATWANFQKSQTNFEGFIQCLAKF